FNAPSIALLGQNAAALRLPWALVGVATVIAAYALVARLHGHTLALVSAALLAGYHYHIHFSRLGSNQIADGLFATLALLCLYRGYDRRNPFDYALCGAVIGVAQYFYAGARFVGVLIMVVVAVLALRDGRRFWREQGWGIAILAGAALLSAAPMIQYAFRFPAEYNARLNEVGIIQSGWLEREQTVRNQGAVPILIDQFWRAALAYNAYPDRTVWYGSPRPLFDLAHGTLFILGLGFALTRLFDRRIFPLVAWWGGAIVLGGMLTESPPSSQRLVTTAIPAIVFVALGLALLVQGLGQALGAARPARLAPVLSIATVALAALSARYYFVEYTPTRVYGNANALLATELAHYANDHLPPDSRLVFFGWPRMGADFGTLPYLAPHIERFDVHDPLREPPGPTLAAHDHPTAFVFVPERAGELGLVQFAFPNGTVEEAPSPVDGAPLFTVYQLPAPVGGDGETGFP
ncbi:MAG: ArnT family glycosyltransferase, partial [Chloroflexaceae bacterium]